MDECSSSHAIKDGRADEQQQTLAVFLVFQVTPATDNIYFIMQYVQMISIVAAANMSPAP